MIFNYDQYGVSFLEPGCKLVSFFLIRVSPVNLGSPIWWNEAAIWHPWPASNPFSALICVLEFSSKIRKGICFVQCAPPYLTLCLPLWPLLSMLNGKLLGSMSSSNRSLKRGKVVWQPPDRVMVSLFGGTWFRSQPPWQNLLRRRALWDQRWWTGCRVQSNWPQLKDLVEIGWPTTEGILTRVGIPSLYRCYSVGSLSVLPFFNFPRSRP